MPELQEGRYAGEFVVSEGRGAVIIDRCSPGTRT
jgi:hypothetical protein